ncbi:pilus assembly protein TadB, partial [Vibrio vulnificus]
MDDITYFFVLLFFAVVFISQALILPAAGSKAKHKELSQRLKETQMNLDEEARSLLQEHYLKSLSPLDRSLVKVAAFASLKKSIELSGLDWSLAQTLMVCSIISLTTIVTMVILAQPWYLAVAGGSAIWFALQFFLQKRITDRLNRFE